MSGHIRLRSYSRMSYRYRNSFAGRRPSPNADRLPALQDGVVVEYWMQQRQSVGCRDTG
jgi:hypothetical protein